MEAIEKAIRKALEKGDAADEAFRERVYRSAFSALERALRERQSLSPAAVEIRRERLRAKIAEIETEFVPAVSAPDSHDAKAGPRLQSDRFSDAEPRIAPHDRIISENETATADRGGRTRARRRRRPRRAFAWLFVAALIFAAIGIGTWWTMTSGILLSPEERDTSVPNPPARLDDEDFAPGGTEGTAAGSAPERDWIDIYSPGASTDVNVPAGVVAEIVEEDGVAYLRLGGDGDSEVSFEVGRGTLERLAGRTAMFSIAARASGEEITRISVGCLLAELGDCGRKRFELGPAVAEFLFELALPDRAPGAAGTIVINPDIEGSGGAIDIREIRVSVTP